MKSGLCIAVFYSITVFSLCQGECIQRSCMKSTLFMACAYCNNSGGELYGLKQIKTNQELVKIFRTAVDQEGPMWTNDEKFVCLKSEKEHCIGLVTNTSGTLSNASCSDEFHFFCYHTNDSKCEKCPVSTTTEPTTTGMTTTASSTTNLTSTSTVNASQKGPNQTVLIIFSVVGFLCLVAIISGVVCFLFKRRSNVNITELGEEKSMYQGEDSRRDSDNMPESKGDETTHV